MLHRTLRRHGYQPGPSTGWLLARHMTGTVFLAPSKGACLPTKKQRGRVVPNGADASRQRFAEQVIKDEIGAPTPPLAAVADRPPEPEGQPPQPSLRLYRRYAKLRGDGTKPSRKSFAVFATIQMEGGAVAAHAPAFLFSHGYKATPWTSHGHVDLEHRDFKLMVPAPQATRADVPFSSSPPVSLHRHLF